MADSSLRLVFAGTPAFAVPALEACLSASGVEVTAVLTQPDRPSGRGRLSAQSPVKQAAIATGIPVLQPPSLKAPEVLSDLAGLTPDLMVVVAYGLILPRAVLALPVHGCWNLHASLLPRWRGAAPIQRALAEGDAETGVCLMQMEPGLDSGPVLLRAKTPITELDTGGSLHDRLAQLGAELLVKGLVLLRAGTPPAPQRQPRSGATYARKLDKSESRLDFTRSAQALERQIRAFNPWPGTEAAVAGETLRIWRAQVLRESNDSNTPTVSPGHIIAASRSGIDFSTGRGVLRVTEVQRSGGRRIHAADYLNARPDLRVRR